MNSFSTSVKVFAIVALLSTLTASAMETAAQGIVSAEPVVAPAPVVVTTNAVEPIAKATNAVESAASAVKNEAKKDCGVKCSISKAWNNLAAAVTTQKNKIVDTAKEMKCRGWSKWTTKEKAGVVIGGTLVAATAAYVVYKVYKSFTAPKVKRSPRA